MAQTPNENEALVRRLSNDINQFKTSHHLPDDLESMTGAISHLQKQAQEVMRQKPTWLSYFQGQMITKEDYDFISNFDQLNAEGRAKLLSDPNSRNQCAKTFLTLMAKVYKQQTLRYLLTLMDECLREDKSRVEIFNTYARMKKEQLWSYFFNMFANQDQFVVYQTSRIIAKLACWSVERMPASDLSYYLAWLKEQLKPQGNEYLQSVCRSLQMMLRIEQYREAFVAIDGIPSIMQVLNNASVGFQVQYQLTFCLWVLTFNTNIAAIMSKYTIIPRLAEILAESQKEKVTRMIVAFLRNLLEKPESDKVIRDNAMTMIACRLVKPLELLSNKKFDDDDINENIIFIKEKLEGNLADVTSFDEYAVEIRSGRLSWTPVHQSEKFWVENAAKLNETNFELLRMLLRLLEQSKEPLVLCVAAHDVGEYVRHYPHGKKAIDKLEGKVIIMRLLENPDSNVRYQGLLCVQKLMVHNWDYLGKQADASAGNNSNSTNNTLGQRPVESRA
ncbi:unnamed protein product [Adineta steineri]|uniref:V-type proton ATPase subunit H n=1 Tax=Adineta steineri TaxID=433720 RepID=A0A814JTT6_9BILA|nr:unnamed protein product [Adineta steineri]